MNFQLTSQNVLDYLIKHDFCARADKANSRVEPLEAKNFNLLVTLPNTQKLLVKQERQNRKEKTAGEFLGEWRIQKFLQQFPEHEHFCRFLPQVLHFNLESSLMIFHYVDDYQDLMDFYTKEKNFHIEIASAIGTFLATLHRDTFNHQQYQNFFTPTDQVKYLIKGLERIEPEIFGSVPADGIKFLALYQRYDSLGNAIAQLTDAFNPCCLVHNDLKLNNILLYLNWERALVTTEPLVRLIDWERCSWGDPALDLGNLIASYLQLWLSSLVVSKNISLEESLRLAITPLEQIQPSIAALTAAYLKQFPEILTYRPDFLHRVVQFAGIALIHQIQAAIQYQKAFGNAGICTLQVAKSLLCRPAQSISTVFGCSESELSDRDISYQLPVTK
jgi:5-methylthioribose kinase